MKFRLNGALSRTSRSSRCRTAASTVSCSAPGLSGFAFSLTLHLLAGELPKQLPTSLEVLTLGEDTENTNEFTGGIPSEWGALTNLKWLKIVNCGLDGKPLGIRSERFQFRVDMFTFSAGELPKELGKLVSLAFFDAAGNKLQGGLSTRTERLRILADTSPIGR